MKKNNFLKIVTICFVIFSNTIVNGQNTELNKESRLEWFKDAKLGIFIHWGIFAVNGIDESWSFHNKYISYSD